MKVISRSVVQEAWVRSDHNVFRGLEAVTEDSISSNKNDFGNIFQRKRRLEQRLCGFQCCLDCNPSDALASSERKLQKEYFNGSSEEEESHSWPFSR